MVFLRQVCRGEVDRDPLRRKRQTHGGQGRAHPLAALTHGLVGQADERESRHSRRDLTLHFNRARFQSQVGDSGDESDQLQKFPAERAALRDPSVLCAIDHR